MSGDRGAKAAAGRLRTIVDRFFDGLVYISTLRLRFDPKQKRHALWDRAHRSNNFNHAEFRHTAISDRTWKQPSR